MKKMIKILIAAGALLMGSVAGVFASPLENKNALGLYVLGGEPVVSGLQYERRYNDIVSQKFDLFVVINPESTSILLDKYNVNFNTELDFTLFKAPWGDHFGSRLFAYGLAGYQFRSVNTYEYDRDAGKEIYGVKTTNQLILGGGFGFEFLIADHLSIPVQLGFIGAVFDDPCANFCAGIAIRYSW